MKTHVHLTTLSALALTFTILCPFLDVVATRCKSRESDGDKWFDGCKWCVCEHYIPVCSSSNCSHLNAQLPPCVNIGSRWSDGCYNCTCSPQGIECKANDTCVASLNLARFFSMSAYVLTQGACIKPQDNRCVCGVDGVPSCTADAIDRNAIQATTISLGPSPRPSLLTRSNARRSDLFRSSSYPSVTRSSRFSSQGSRSAGLYSHARGIRRMQSNDPHPFLSRQRRSLQNDFDGQISDVKRDRVTSSLSILSTSTQHPPSLLVTTDNRCRQIVKSKYLSTENASTKVKGESWKESACTFCKCHVNGVALCSRDESCPAPYLITPVAPSADPGIPDVEENKPSISDQFKDKGNDQGLFLDIPPEDTNNDNAAAAAAAAGDEDSYDADDEIENDDNLNNGNSVYDIIRPDQVSSSIDREDSLESEDRYPERRQTNVIVRQCEPNTRWLDGCLRCYCNSRGLKWCDNQRCLLPAPPPDPRHPQGHRNNPNLLRREPATPPRRQTSCGRFQLNQRYWVRCNLCRCTTSGPQCTAMACN
ncbi:hypothetical protein PoB_006797700 [Plakobranchus ocellatus]|uniref:Pacifastin domain-containing protein n=1 Tax=Plakobranchus ocellatus TaxID=259542 RepID=A0AAV4DB77_9GAST|nr:hypothetical protein PoB_006797700 [Plakobranchus ocellatus]